MSNEEDFTNIQEESPLMKTVSLDPPPEKPTSKWCKRISKMFTKKKKPAVSMVSNDDI